MVKIDLIDFAFSMAAYLGEVQIIMIWLFFRIFLDYKLSISHSLECARLRSILYTV